MICITLGGTPTIGKIVFKKIRNKKFMRFEIKMAQNEKKWKNEKKKGKLWDLKLRWLKMKKNEKMKRKRESYEIWN